MKHETSVLTEVIAAQITQTVTISTLATHVPAQVAGKMILRLATLPVSILMSVLAQRTTAMLNQPVRIQTAVSRVLVTQVSLEMALFAMMLMSAIREIPVVTKMQHASTIKVAMVASVMKASPGTEQLVLISTSVLGHHVRKIQFVLTQLAHSPALACPVLKTWQS